MEIRNQKIIKEMKAEKVTMKGNEGLVLKNNPKSFAESQISAQMARVNDETKIEGNIGPSSAKKSSEGQKRRLL